MKRMKKALLSFVAVLLCTVWLSAAQAQTTTPAKATTAPGPTKKDGTADMRYKANKNAAKPTPAGPTKKDGTADMRYKANKDAAKSSGTTTQPKTTKTNASTKKPAPAKSGQ
jgi:hypothetical protein